MPADLPLIFAELHRLLKKDGYLIVNTPNVASLLKRLNLLRGKNPTEFDLRLHEGATYGHIREYTLSEIITALHSSKLIVKDHIYFSIDTERSPFTRWEDRLSKIVPSLANSILVSAQKG